MDDRFVIKNIIDGEEITFEILPDEKGVFLSDDEINKNIAILDAKLEVNQERIDEEKKLKEKYTPHLDKIDYLVSVCSGVVTGIIDAFIKKKFSFTKANELGTKEVNKIVISIAKGQGYKGNEFNGAVSFLEGHHIAADTVESEFGGGLQHHLKDFSHHLSPAGLLFSIMTQFTGKVYGTDAAGKFISVPVGEKGKPYLGNTLSNKIAFGIKEWIFHMASDVAGSSNSTRAGKAGSGLPGPILSFVKTISSSPVFGKENSELRENISKNISKIFNGTSNSLIQENGQPVKFDFRTELGYSIVSSIPVLINQVVVRTFYFIRRLILAIKSIHSFDDFLKINWRDVLPFNNPSINRMVLVSSGTLTAIDLAATAIKSAKNSGGNPYAFLANFVLRINYFGIICFGTSIVQEIKYSILRNKHVDNIIRLHNERIAILNAKTYYLLNDTWNELEDTEKSLKEVSEMIKIVSKFLVEASRLNNEDIKKIGTYKEDIDDNNPELNKDILDILDW